MQSRLREINRIKEEFEGRKLYLCIPGGINGRRLNIMQNDLSYCHEVAISDKPYEVDHICSIEEFSVETYYEKAYELINKFQDDSFSCRKCPHCQKMPFHFSLLKLVTINTNTFCNSRCIYCSAHSEDNKSTNPMIIIEQLDNEMIIDKDCLFDWGGGEPTANKYFNDTVKYLRDRNYRQRINTNAIIFSDEAAKALENKRTMMRISADSGSEKGYYRVKGTRNYTLFWKNIKQYCSISDEVYLKYNLFNENSDISEIDAFIDNCIRCGVHHVLIDAEISSYQPDKNYGPFYFTEKEFSAVHYLAGKN